MAFMVFWYFYLLCMSVLCQNLTGENICLNATFKGCCKDYKQVGNTCVECDSGFRGNNCSLPCPTNYFGRRCSQKCNCSSIQYCDSRRGCLCNVTSDNCTDFNELETTETQLTTSLKLSKTTSGYEKVYTANPYVFKIGIPSLLSVIVFLVIGHISLRFYQKKKQRTLLKETHCVDDSQIRNTPNGTVHQQTADQLPRGTTTDTSETYSHLSLRVNCNDTNRFSDNMKSLTEREESMLLPGRCPLTSRYSRNRITKRTGEKGKTSPEIITEHDEIHIPDTMENSQRDNNAENVYLDMQCTGLENMKKQKKPNVINGQSPLAVSKQSKGHIRKGKVEEEKPAIMPERSVYTISKKIKMQKPNKSQDRQIDNGDVDNVEDESFDVCYPTHEKKLSPEHYASPTSNPYVQDEYGADYANCENELYINC